MLFRAGIAAVAEEKASRLPLTRSSHNRELLRSNALDKAVAHTCVLTPQDGIESRIKQRFAHSLLLSFSFEQISENERSIVSELLIAVEAQFLHASVAMKRDSEHSFPSPTTGGDHE